MLTQDNIKLWLQKSQNYKEKIGLTLATFEKPVSPKEVQQRAGDSGFREALRSSNFSRDISRSGYAVRVADGWELSLEGQSKLRDIGVQFTSHDVVILATDLRTLADKLSDEDLKSFVYEAIQAYEANLLRSAVVMSWLGAVAILQDIVVKNNLQAFNTEASRINSKWKKAVTTDDLGLMNESTFLDRLQGISIIGKNVKQDLQECLKRRNACGHPNSYKLGERTVAHHIETLILNVYSKF